MSQPHPRSAPRRQDEEPFQQSALGVISVWTTSHSSPEAHIVDEWPAMPPPSRDHDPDPRRHDKPRRVRLLRPDRQR